jgi:hypothetical protein
MQWNQSNHFLFRALYESHAPFATSALEQQGFTIGIIGTCLLMASMWLFFLRTRRA